METNLLSITYYSLIALDLKRRRENGHRDMRLELWKWILKMDWTRRLFCDWRKWDLKGPKS